MHCNLKIMIALAVVIFSSIVVPFINPRARKSEGFEKLRDEETEQPARPLAQSQPREGPVSVLDLTAMTQKADLIVVGQVVSVQDGGTLLMGEGRGAEARRLIVSMKVRRTLKGPETTG